MPDVLATAFVLNNARLEDFVRFVVRRLDTDVALRWEPFGTQIDSALNDYVAMATVTTTAPS
jgi:hypothetical protein